jgi:hypothetical protein
VLGWTRLGVGPEGGDGLVLERADDPTRGVVGFADQDDERHVRKRIDVPRELASSLSVLRQ